MKRTRNGPPRVNEVRKRARRLMEREERLSYGDAMKEAGWMVRRAAEG